MDLKKDKNHFQVLTKKMDISRDDSGKIKSIILEGYASTKNKDRVNDIVLPSAFEKALEQYMQNPRVFLQHDPDKNIGQTIEATINTKGLYVKTEILLNMSLDGTDEIRLFDAIEKGLYKTYSIGYKVNDVEEVEVRENGRIKGYERVIKDLDLFEISLVAVPANPYALIKSVSDCLPDNTELSKEDGMKQIENMSGEAILSSNIKQMDEVKEEVKEETKVEEVVEEIKETPEVEPKEETDVKDVENSPEIGEDVSEKSNIISETKSHSVETYTKKEALQMETKFNEEVASLKKSFENSTLEIIDFVKELRNENTELKSIVNGLEGKIGKVVIQKGYTYENLPTKSNPVADAIKSVRK